MLHSPSAATPGEALLSEQHVVRAFRPLQAVAMASLICLEQLPQRSLVFARDHSLCTLVQVRSVAVDAAVEQELQQLRAENEALRRALAAEQGVSPTEVRQAAALRTPLSDQQMHSRIARSQTQNLRYVTQPSPGRSSVLITPGERSSPA